MISSKPPIWHYSARSRRDEIGSWLMVHEKGVARCNSFSLSEPKKTKSTHSTEVANDWGEEGSGCRHEADEWHTPVQPATIT